MKKSLAAVCFMTALILLSASGCGSSGSKSNEKTTAAKKPAVTDKAEKDSAEGTQTDTVPEEDPDDGGNTTVLGAGLENTRKLFSGDYSSSRKP
jgi:hypothetical protein